MYISFERHEHIIYIKYMHISNFLRSDVSLIGALPAPTRMFQVQKQFSRREEEIELRCQGSPCSSIIIRVVVVTSSFQATPGQCFLYINIYEIFICIFVKLAEASITQWMIANFLPEICL